MRYDRAEVSWDAQENSWLIRIQMGEEVIRRHCKAPRDADENRLRSAAEETVRDEGYEPASGVITIAR